MPWWAWLSGGFLLMVLELAAVDAAFYLVFLGASAVFVGILVFFEPAFPFWGQYVLYSIVAVTSVVFFRRRLYERLRGGAPGFDGSTVGETVEVTEYVPVGGMTRLAMRGSQWTATNIGMSAIDAGTRAKVVAVTGATVEIKPMVVDRTPSADDGRD